MDAKVGVLVLHGAGAHKPDFADGLTAELERRLGKAEVRPGSVAWQPAHWADLVAGREKDLWRRVARDQTLDWVSMRMFMMDTVGVAVAGQRVPGKQADMCRAIHLRIHAHLCALRAKLGQRDKPLIVVAHGLGSVFMSNHIWDEQADRGLGITDFERMHTLCGLFTTGTQIPLHTLALAEEEIQSIEFPPRTLPQRLLERARWSNFFDADDALGYPLKTLNLSYARNVTEDVELEVGGLMAAWNPVQQKAYWEDEGFLDAVAEQVKQIVQAC